MPRPHPIELRERVVAAYKSGEGSFRTLAQRFMVGEASVNRWVSRERRTGSVDASPMGGGHRERKVDEAGQALLRDLIDNNPDCTLRELCAEYRVARNVVVSTQTMSDTLRWLGYTRKRGSFAGRRPTAPMWLRRGKPS